MNQDGVIDAACAHCKRILGGPAEERKAEEGDILVCSFCGCIQEMTKRMTLRRIPQSETHRIPTMALATSQMVKLRNKTQ